MFALALMGMAGCGVSRATDSTAALSVFVQVEDPDAACFATCEGASIDEGIELDETCDVTKACDDLPIGDTRLRLLAHYVGVEFESPLEVEVPTTAAFADAAAAAVESGTWIAVDPSPDVEGDAWFQQTVQVPILDASSLWFRVTGVAGFVGDTPPIGLVANAPVVDILDCPDGVPCELAAGVGSVDVTVSAAHYAPDTIDVRAFVDAVAVSSSSVTLEAADASGTRIARVSVPIPDRIGGSFQVRAGEGAWQGVSEVATLRRPERIQVGISAMEPSASAEVENLVPPARAGGDADSCREVYVAVRAPDIDQGVAVHLETSLGTFADGASSTDLAVDATGFGWTTLSWDATSADEVQIVATAADLLERTYTWSLEDVHFDSAVVLGPPAAVTVGTNGSEGAAVVGWIGVPFGALLEDHPEISLVVTATPDASLTAGCDDLLTESYIRCDRDRVTGGSPGGCRMTPGGIEIDAAGTFEIPLESGQCFVGDVTVEVWGRMYTSTSETCLGDRDVTSEAVPLGSATVRYEPAP